jgi:hypothetical protein
MIGVKWVGWDGSEWDLRSGLVHLAKGGLQGAGFLRSEAFTQETALSDGQRFTGWRARPRTVLLPVIIGQAANETDFMAIDTAWWKTMRVDKTGSLQVTAPNGITRKLDCRFVNDGGVSFDSDPTQQRLSTAVIELVADQPWWVGPTFTQKFSDGSTPQNFFGGEAGSGPPFVIGSANTLGSAIVANPGNAETWPTYYIDGPALSFSIEIDGAPVSGSIALDSDQQLRIETAPNRQVAMLVTGGSIDARTDVRTGGTETNVTRLLADVQFAPIPEAGQVTVDIALNGAGRITLSGNPRYFKAWG